MKKYIITLVAASWVSLTAAYADHPFYIGASLGYGSTDWSELVNQDPNPDNAPLVLDASPDSAKDSGRDYGFFIGYTFTPNYALELSYRRFQTSYVHFNILYSLYEYGDGTPIQDFYSSTYNYSLLNKFIWNVTNSFSLFSDLGPGYTHRSDILANASNGISYGPSSIAQIVATFGAGANYEITPHFMATVEGDYSTGWGKSELYPVDDYVPFLYSVDFKLAYRF